MIDLTDLIFVGLGGLILGYVIGVNIVFWSINSGRESIDFLERAIKQTEWRKSRPKGKQ
jgi:hypothetical protein